MKKEEVSEMVRELQRLAKYHPPLSKKEEDKLIDEIRRGDKSASKKLLLHYLRLILKLAFKYKHYNIPLDDLINEGILAFYEGIKDYDPKMKKGMRLQYYIYKFIRGAMLLYIMKNLTSMSLISSYKDVFDFTSLKDVGDFREIKDERKKAFYYLTRNDDLSLEGSTLINPKTAHKSEEEIEHLDKILPDPDYDLLRKIEDDEIREKILDFLDEELLNLKKDERFIIYARFLHNPPLSYKEISEILGITTIEVHSKEYEILNRLRLKFHSKVMRKGIKKDGRSRG